MRGLMPWNLPAMPGETPEQLAARREEAYFQMTLDQNEEWRSRLGKRLDFRNRKVLEIGCGHGSLSLNAAESGAKLVMGIDLSSERIQFARSKLQAGYSCYRDRVQFLEADIGDLHETFDLIISKDTFEHVLDLRAMLDVIWRLLEPGGLLAVGFSPLYYSPNGDHGRWGFSLPWLHAFLPETYLVKRHSRRTGRKVAGAEDLGLNRITPADFRLLMSEHPWSECRISYNQGSNPLLRLLNVLRRVTPLEHFFTVSIYAIARKPAAPDRIAT